jgi:hypothetical protein
MLILGATLANTLVYPTLPRWWLVSSAVLFVFALGETGWIFSKAGVFDIFVGRRRTGWIHRHTGSTPV